MTGEQIEILLRDGDISERPGQKFCSGDFSFHTTDKCYYISLEMYQIFEKLFDFYGCSDGLSGEYGYDTGEIDGMLRAEIEYRKNSPGAKLKILQDILEDQYQKLKKKIGQITFHNNPGQIIESWFFYFFLYDGEAIVKSLKFDLLNGKNLSSFTMNEYMYSLLEDTDFEKYYNTDDMQMIYDVISVEKSIKYIQSLITDINKPKKDQPTHRDKAIAYIFQMYEYPDKYPTLRRVDAKLKKNGGKNFEIALALLGYFGKKTKPFVLEDLIRVKEFGLLDNPDEPKALEYLNRRIKELSYPQS